MKIPNLILFSVVLAYPGQNVASPLTTPLPAGTTTGNAPGATDSCWFYTVTPTSSSTVSVPTEGLAPLWGICGGIGHTGPTQCVPGADCVVLNDFWSQCLPAPKITTTTTPAPITLTVCS